MRGRKGVQGINDQSPASFTIVPVTVTYGSQLEWFTVQELELFTGGVTVGDSGLCCCVPCLSSAIISLLFGDSTQAL